MSHLECLFSRIWFGDNVDLSFHKSTFFSHPHHPPHQPLNLLDTCAALPPGTGNGSQCVPWKDQARHPWTLFPPTCFACRPPQQEVRWHSPKLWTLSNSHVKQHPGNALGLMKLDLCMTSTSNPKILGVLYDLLAY